MSEDSQHGLVDHATGLYNQDGFRILAAQYVKLARRMRKRVGLLLALLEEANGGDSMSQAGKEQRQSNAAEILKLTFRDSDILARVGPDKFAVLVPEIARKGDEAIRRRLEQRVESYNLRPYGSHPLSLRLSMVCPDPKSSYTLDDLFAQAEQQLEDKAHSRH
jgi:diguanylate cyclase (GGDEF)-like protein